MTKAIAQLLEADYLHDFGRAPGRLRMWKAKEKERHDGRSPRESELERRHAIRAKLGGNPFGRDSQPFKVGNTLLTWTKAGVALGRRVRFANQIVRLSHTGWFVSDVNQDETTNGVVIDLPHGRFLAAVSDPYLFDEKTMNGPVALEKGKYYRDEEEAAHAADHLAEKFAEQAREFEEEQRENLDDHGDIDPLPEEEDD